MLNMVLLRHELTDGSHHFDWLVDRHSLAPGKNIVEPPFDPEERSLVAFRVDVRVDQPEIQQFVAHRLKDHRRFYLRHEGPLPGGDRGTVVRIAAGQVRKIDELGGATQPSPTSSSGGSLSIRGRFRGQDEYLWVGMPQIDGDGRETGLWAFVRSAQQMVEFDRDRTVPDNFSSDPLVARYRVGWHDP